MKLCVDLAKISIYSSVWAYCRSISMQNQGKSVCFQKISIRSRAVFRLTAVLFRSRQVTYIGRSCRSVGRSSKYFEKFKILNFSKYFEFFKIFWFQNFEFFKIILKNSKWKVGCHTAYTTEMGQNTLSSVCPVVATVDSQSHSVWFIPT